jgi:UDP-2,4-diacetamido-2,4,6-trideoxy-beta-L-altropyranose hydrolase
MKKIVIRTLGGPGIGYGHYYRCLSLAKALKRFNKNVEILFVVNNALEEILKTESLPYLVSSYLSEDYSFIEDMELDLFTFDSYLADDTYLKRIRQKTKLMLIDDNNDIYDSTIPDIIYNGNIHACDLGYPEADGQLRLLGSEYLIMKEEYWDNDKNHVIDKKGILITTGGTDEYGLALKILKELKKMYYKIRLIIGPGYNTLYIKELEGIKTDNMEFIYMPGSLKQYIRESKIVFTAGGSTVYEVLSQGTIPIIFSIADNQDLICQKLQSMGLEYLGKYPSIDLSSFKYRIDRANIDKELSDRIDGQGAFRIIEKLKRNSFL